MIREATAMTVRHNLGALLNEVQYRHGRVLITKAGKPVAALVDTALLEKFRKLDEEFEQLRGELRGAFSRTPRDEGMRYIEEAIRESRK